MDYTLTQREHMLDLSLQHNDKEMFKDILKGVNNLFAEKQFIKFALKKAFKKNWLDMIREIEERFSIGSNIYIAFACKYGNWEIIDYFYRRDVHYTIELLCIYDRVEMIKNIDLNFYEARDILYKYINTAVKNNSMESLDYFLTLTPKEYLYKMYFTQIVSRTIKNNECGVLKVFIKHDLVYNDMAVKHVEVGLLLHTKGYMIKCASKEMDRMLRILRKISANRRLNFLKRFLINRESIKSIPYLFNVGAKYFEAKEKFENFY